MFKNLKAKIKEIAMIAVQRAEITLGSNKGKEKKEMAIAYIVSHIPIVSPLQKLVAMLLSSFIDDAVEFAVHYMNEGGFNGTNK